MSLSNLLAVTFPVMMLFAATMDFREQVEKQVSVEIRDLERYVDSRMPSFERGVELGELAPHLCTDRWASEQIVRVQREQGTQARLCEP